MAISWKKCHNLSTLCHRKFFDVAKLSYGGSFTSISVLVVELLQFLLIRDWPGIQKSNTLVWGLSNIWRLGQFRDTIFGTNVSNKKALNTASSQDCSFYRRWFIMGKPKGGEIITHPDYGYFKYQFSIFPLMYIFNNLKITIRLRFFFLIRSKFFIKFNYLWSDYQTINFMINILIVNKK